MSRWMHAHLAAVEDAINRSLASSRTRFCYHVDRTVTQDAGGMVRTECDYCPAWAVDRNGMPDLFPLAWTEPPCEPSSSSPTEPFSYRPAPCTRTGSLS